MRIGLNGSSLLATGAPLGQLREHAAQAEADGFSSYWLAQLGVPDALTAIAEDVGRSRSERIHEPSLLERTSRAEGRALHAEGARVGLERRAPEDVGSALPGARLERLELDGERARAHLDRARCGSAAARPCRPGRHGAACDRCHTRGA